MDILIATGKRENNMNNKYTRYRPMELFLLRSINIFILFFGICFSSPAMAQDFTVTVLGARGGLDESNLSAYLVRRTGSSRGVLLDAGTVFHGLAIADRRHAFDDVALAPAPGTARTLALLHQLVGAYLISHAHLDHVAGLLAVSPEDPGKTIYALPSVLSVFRDDLFNHRVWPNLADQGAAPALGLLHYHPLATGRRQSLPGTGLSVTPYPLSHAGVESTAFLLRSGEDALLYLGDTGPDRDKGENRLAALWDEVAPLLRTHRLKGIVIECSYDNSRPDGALFGHLTPRWLLQSLSMLEERSGVSLRGFPVLVSHIKPSTIRDGAETDRIASELEQGNRSGIVFTLAEQGMTIRF
ncbi:3',5'-cyclic-nucleotide phosphodiesterase [Swaminathania salitolerans]|uniref:3',5'-cyclic-nucleotide phosphodiesterase n=2 Tax=Swaminathania salitolerans TaxID=182838 RepID=A0A511BQ87_9PROT|nr:3',5'-cyclic-nucleotide phosphodiesterase [Swaminathania salitolerans]